MAHYGGCVCSSAGQLPRAQLLPRRRPRDRHRNRITLINGAELKQLIKEYLQTDVIPGTSPPKRLRASDNIQTGRPRPLQP
jgi:restriction system protein